MLVRPGLQVALDFTTQNPTTGAAQNNDAGVPTGTISRNGVDDGAVVVAVVNKEVGVYRATFTVPLTYVANDVLSLRIAATVNAIVGKGVVWRALVTDLFPLVPGTIDFTYTLTDDVTLLPIPGALIEFYTNIAMTNLVWRGETDTFGVARDDYNQLPSLMTGTYYIKRERVGYTFTNPDTEIVSNP